MSAPFVVVNGVSKSFKGVKALQDITFSIPEGEIVTLAGPDAAGKTTLLRLIAGLFLPDSGSITIDGLSTVTEAQEISEILGYMPQRFGLYEDLTVEQNLNLYADLKGVVDKEERRNTFEKLLSFTGLSPFTKRLAGNLSGGMKQKLGLACSLLKRPKLLLLDEPTVGVDPISRQELWKIVKDLLTEKITVIWSTSYLEEAERTPTTLLLNEGKLLYQGPPGKLTEQLKGRVFKISHLQENKREVLRSVLNHEEVIDGVIQGSDIRIVTKEKEPPEELKKIAGGHEIEPTAPRYEDAFVDILGGIRVRGSSKLAEGFEEIKKNHKDVIIADHLTKQFGNFTAASDITFTVQRGEIFGLLGPNGAGKTTTFKMLCGLLKPTHGSAHVLGYDLQKARGDALARIGYMAQKFSLYGDLGLRQNLEFFSGVYGLSGKRKKEVIERMTEVFAFKPLLNESAKDLPLGFKQRLSLAACVMHQPEVLFLDEPTSGVDPITRREFWTHINGMVEKGVTVLVTTHFMGEAEYCDRIGLVYQSKLIEIGTPDELKEMSKTEENPWPTLEDAFITLIQRYDAGNKSTKRDS